MSGTIGFIEFRKKAFLISGAIVLFASYNIFFGKINWGIDFTGGTIAHIKFEKNLVITDLREALAEYKPVIQEFSGESSYILKFSQSEEEQNLSAEIKDKLKEKFPENEVTIVRFEMVGPVVGKFLINAALYAFMGALFGIIFYVALRFKGSIWGIAAVIALIHDMVITFGILCFSGVTVDLIVITGLLFIAGYSVNDTIVIYDRIRENLKNFERKKTSEIFNDSIKQTLSRTLITSLTTAIVVLCLFFLGGEIIHNFAGAILIGIVIGTYSSIFIASPLVYGVVGDR